MQAVGAAEMDGSTGCGVYPGELAAPADVLALAGAYREAAIAIEGHGRKGDPISRAPYRLLAIHAIELYLNAHLLHSGREPSYVRGLQHDMAARGDQCVAGDLALRKRTARHLRTIAANREYLVTRYGPEFTRALPPISRLAATLEEVATKVARAMGPQPQPAKVASP